MATYVIGDIQGCFEPLGRLLDRFAFDSARDRVWLVGDLVNRGPASLEVLRWARQVKATVVLGNHEIYLLARAAGLKRKKSDTLDAVFAADDFDDLVHWLRHCPLIHREGDRMMLHAGLMPQWSLAEAQAWAGRLESRLRGPEWRAAVVSFFAPPDPADVELHQALAALTRARLVDPFGRLALGFKGPPQDAPAELTPWYRVAQAVTPALTIYFGHWAAQGFVQGPGYVGLDTGCVWGQQLTAIRQEDGAVFTVPASP